MSSTLKFIVSIMNYFHDKLVLLTRQLDLNFNDKQLHFLVIGFLGIVLFILVNRLFKYLVRYSLTVISFIYTFTVLVVLVFAIEIGQKITGRGNMEFQDIVEGLWGFLIAFVLYQGIVIIARWLKRAIKYTLLGIQ
ncbi:hypothetical protein [Desulfosporosinus sp. BICA1-9]|uniref:hypothetical protein n=1 Tax=Desulfosporosinus sp. BICA1-9 TaxID=1531958 RepID=UPI000B0C82B2|nr:hypothetical protein [Desulfosporosinus sp. BICA1-9]HBW35826.1 hypothetical protein [Desulfosporosinus sp.]